MIDFLSNVKDIYKAMKSIDLYKLVKLTFPNAQLILSDVDYAMPQSAWLTGAFYDFYQSWRSDFGFSEWTNKDDCDNFASLFFCFAQLCHAKSDRAEQAIAVGEIFYHIGGDQTKGHAINVAATEKGLITIEPQTGRIEVLSKTERESSWFIRF